MHSNRSLQRRSWLSVLAALGLILSSIVVAVLVAAPANASHGRATQITWVQTGPTTVEFHSVVAFRASFYGNPAVGSTISEPCLDFGDGTPAHCEGTVETLDMANDVLTAELEVSHTYASAGPFTAEISGCCRLSSPAHVNNPDGAYRAVTTVDLTTTSANPVSSISPIVDCALNATCSFSIPAVAPAGGTLRFRLATSSEASTGSFTQPGPPQATNAATINPTTGLYSWNTTGATLNGTADTFYSTQVVIENLAPNGSVRTQSPVDFFIRLTSSPNQQPVFTAPTPADSTVIQATVGQPLTIPVRATDPDTGDVVTLGLVGKPAAATFTTSAANPAVGTFAWTPPSAGQTILTLTAADQHGRQATQRSVIINAAVVVSPTMYGRAYAGAANLSLLGLPSVLIPPVGDTGQVATKASTSAQSGCNLTLTCARVTTNATTRRVDASASVVGKSLTFPWTHVPPSGAPAPDLVLRAVTATSTSTCAGSVGATTIAYLKVGNNVLISGPTSVAPNTTVNVGALRVVLNEQVPSANPQKRMTVNAIHVYVGSPATVGANVVLASASTGIDAC